MIKYLKSTTGPSAINLDSVGTLAENITRLNNAVRMGNVTASISSTTGTLVVVGGVGIGGNINIAGNIAGGNIVVNNARVNAGLTVVGTISSTNINNSGSITASSANIGIINATTVSATGLGTFDALQVNNLANIGSLSAISGTISTLTSTDISTSTLSASNASTTNLYVDSVFPRTGAQIDFGNADKVRITGGATGQVLGTDGNGNLAWFDGPGALTVGTGLVRTNNVIGLSSTGFTPGVYDRVTVDQFGRVVSGTSFPETLDSVVARDSFTSRVISITNTTDSADPTEGALIVSGGVGVGATLVANQVISKGDTIVEGMLQALNGIQSAQTAVFNGATSGSVPLVITSGGLVSGATSGSIEFDGDNLYVTTNSGRQILQVRDPSAPASPAALVRAAATTNIDISSANQIINDIDVWDDVILNLYDRVLLSQQTDPVENGVYIWHGEGAALTRATDFNATSGIVSGTAVFVAEGVLNRGSIWQITTPNPISVGNTGIEITQHQNLDSIAIAALPKDSSSGLVTRTEYGAVELRSVRSTSTWLTVANADAKLGNITISTGTVPVGSGGTGRTSITGWMKGTGSAISSFAKIPLADISGVGTMASQNANNVSITGGNIDVTSITANVGNIDTLTVANLIITGDGFGQEANSIQLGTNSAGSLSTPALTVTPTSNVTDTLALMNVVLGKLVPPPPPNFPGGQTISISGLTTARMTNFTQDDRTATRGKNVAPGTVVSSILRSSNYTTNSITGTGPGDTGTVAVYKNGSIAGSVALSGDDSGTYNDLVVSNNQDYSNINSSVAANFWYSFDARASGTVLSGWNEVYLDHTAADPTNTAVWYSDTSSPGAPGFTNAEMAVTSNVVTYSSSIPHYTSNTRFRVEFLVNTLSGHTYPTTDTFVTGTAGGAFQAPASLTYAAAGIATPLERNLHVSGGWEACVTSANVISGFGSSTLGPRVNVDNSYNVGVQSFSPGATVLYKTGTGNQIEETSIPVNSVGTGSGNGARIISISSSDTPSFAASAATFTALNTYDATVVAAVMKHDQTNYSTGYLPVGPNLSSGRSGAQYFTFKFVRTVVSKFDIKYTGTLAGLWVALPGSAIDTSSTLNGWLTMATAYNGSGVPGAGIGGNGSNGCAVGGTATLNSAVTNKRVTATFGTASSSSTATNEIYVRIKLTAGQTITAISIEAATN